LWQQSVGQVARLAASQVQARYQRERAERDRRLERLAVEVLTALGERDAMIAATEQRAAAALQAMITGNACSVGSSKSRTRTITHCVIPLGSWRQPGDLVWPGEPLENRQAVLVP